MVTMTDGTTLKVLAVLHTADPGAPADRTWCVSRGNPTPSLIDLVVLDGVMTTNAPVHWLNYNGVKERIRAMSLWSPDGEWFGTVPVLPGRDGYEWGAPWWKVWSRRANSCFITPQFGLQFSKVEDGPGPSGKYLWMGVL